MTSIHKLSSEALLPELDIFTVPPTQKSIERSYETQHRPISSITGGNYLEFHIPTSKDEYILMHETYLYVKMQLVMNKNDNTAMTEADWVWLKPANNLLHSMIKQVELKLGNREVTSSSNTYAYRAYFENLLGYGKSAKDTHLQCCLWNEDAAERRGYFLPATNNDKIGESKVVDLYGKLHVDLTFQGKALIGGCDLQLKLILNTTDFAFEYSNAVTLNHKIIDSCLFVHRLRAYPGLVTAHAKALALAPAKYPITRVEVKHIPIPSQSMDAVLDNIIIGQLPRRLFLGCVSNKAFNGSREKDPFRFEHFNISQAICYLNGVQYPSNGYQPDFDKGNYIREYSGLFQAMNMNSTESTIDIKRKEFADGKTIFGFNFAPDLSHGCDLVGHVNPINHGTLRIYLKFAKALAEVIDVVIFCEYDNIIEIDYERNIASDYKNTVKHV
ncbi:uncharacterized protein F54H12.2-like [Tetranychus urticae]|uniref:uncharacterized protein F54H12.2-like n=1 Tax=Tetranychus urticae TaxID=32264 RepID=UPI000D659ADE|nr:uncharacterized protein F54H12.2-like [Tetranychus urticae]